MTNTQWTLLSLGSQQHVPGAFRASAANVRHAPRVRLAPQDSTTSQFPAVLGAAAGIGAGLSLKSHPTVNFAPWR